MVCLSGNASISDVVAIADARVRVSIPEHVTRTLREVWRTAREISARVPTYGCTTGVGANKSTAVEQGDELHGLRLLRSHAVDAGAPLPDRTVRAMLGVRLNQMCVAGSGIHPDVLPAVARMLNEDALPVVRGHASIGTGDLGALAGTALTLLGERPATRPLPAMEAWPAGSALPFISSNALTIARMCLAVDELDRLDRASSLVYALTFLGLDGNPEAFSPAAVAAAAAPGVGDVAGQLRGLLSGCPDTRRAARIQDAYGLRAHAIAQGAFRASLAGLADQATRCLNAAQENPLFDTAAGRVVHHAAFHQAALGLAADGCNLALAQTAPLTLSRIRMLGEPAYTGRAAFLADGPAGSSGLMMVEYVAASAAAELRSAATPASLGTVVLSRGMEEDASFASQAAVQTERAVAAYRVLLSCELLGAVRLLRQRGLITAVPEGPLRAAAAVATQLPADGIDRDLRPDLEIAQELLDDLARLV